MYIYIYILYVTQVGSKETPNMKTKQSPQGIAMTSIYTLWKLCTVPTLSQTKSEMTFEETRNYFYEIDYTVYCLSSDLSVFFRLIVVPIARLYINLSL